MDPSALRDQVIRAKAEGKTPLYVNATAGTTVMGSYDPFHEISAVCREPYPSMLERQLARMHESRG